MSLCTEPNWKTDDPCLVHLSCCRPLWAVVRAPSTVQEASNSMPAFAFFTLLGGPPPPTASQPASVNIPGSLPSSTPYTMPPEPTLSQNPLSIMMSRMSKFAMPSSTPLYHDAIKTVASSDDDSPPARSPNLPSMNNMPGKTGPELVLGKAAAL